MTVSKSVLSLALVVYALVAVVFLALQSKSASAEAPSGLYATVASSALMAVTSTASVTLIATSSCAARIVSTPGTFGVMLTFRDQDTPTGTFGVWQGASTTVAYNGGLYGCGAVKALGQAAGTVTIIDTR